MTVFAMVHVQPGHQPPSSDPWVLEEQEEEKRKRHKHEAKEFRKYHNMVSYKMTCSKPDQFFLVNAFVKRNFTVHYIFHQVMDELLPKATGKEARIEKKKIEREKKRARGTSPGK